jgi:hypothetical protein
MIKRLEQVAALVVAAGLAIVSYWLFFSWAQGNGVNRPGGRGERSGWGLSPQAQMHPVARVRSEASPGLEQPLFAGAVVEGGHVTAHLLSAHGQVELQAESHDSVEGS